MNTTHVQPRILTVTSGKGGVGKTFLALQIAGEIARAGSRVVLFDGDMGLANVHVLLGINPSLTLSDVAAGRCGLAETLLSGPHGLKIAPGGSGHQNMADLSSLEFVRLLGALEDLPEAPEFIVIDTGAGIGRHVLTLSQIADRVLVVIKDDPASLADAYGLIKVLNTDFGRANFDLLVNDVVSTERGTAIYDRLQGIVSKFLGIPLNLLGVIPHDSNVRAATRRRKLLADEFALSAGARAIRTVANSYRSNTNTKFDGIHIIDRLKSEESMDNG